MGAALLPRAGRNWEGVSFLLQTCEKSVGLSECAHLLTLSRHFRWLPTWQKLAASEHSESVASVTKRVD